MGAATFYASRERRVTPSFSACFVHFSPLPGRHPVPRPPNGCFLRLRGASEIMHRGYGAAMGVGGCFWPKIRYFSKALNKRSTANSPGGVPSLVRLLGKKPLLPGPPIQLPVNIADSTVMMSGSAWMTVGVTIKSPNCWTLCRKIRSRGPR